VAGVAFLTAVVEVQAGEVNVCRLVRWRAPLAPYPAAHDEQFLHAVRSFTL